MINGLLAQYFGKNININYLKGHYNFVAILHTNNKNLKQLKFIIYLFLIRKYICG